MTEQTPAQKRAAELEARLAASGITAEKPPVVEHTFDPECIPQVDDRPDHPLKEQIHAALGGQPIVEANNRWGRSPLNRVSSDESNKVTCPNPTHKDAVRSAWICVSKNVFACAVCENKKHPGKYGGGDAFALAGYHFNLDPTTQFVQLLEAMASDLGLAVTKRASGLSVTAIPESVTETFEKTSVVSIAPEPDEEPADEIPDFPVDTYPPGTPARDWCDELENQTDWHPNFIRALALPLLGAAGREQVYYVDEPCVTAKFHLCLLGDTSTGKSRPINVLQRLFSEVLPFNTDTGAGLLQFDTVGSGEALLEKFAFSTGTPPEPLSINGCWFLREFQEIYHKQANDTRKDALISLSDWFRHDYHHSVRSKDGRFTCHHPYCQVITTSQPNYLHEYLARKDVYSGSLGRWLFTAANKSRQETRLKTHVELTKAINSFRNLLTWTTTERAIDVDAYAPGRAAFADAYDRFKSSDTLHDSPLLGRTGLHFKRIVVALCINDKNPVINEDVVERASLIMPFFLKCAQLVDTKLNFDEDTDYQNRILTVRDSFYKKHNRWPSQREVQKNLGARYTNKAKIKQAYQILEATGDMFLYDPPGRKDTGRPPTKIVGPGLGDKTEVRG